MDFFRNLFKAGPIQTDTDDASFCLEDFYRKHQEQDAMIAA